MRKLPLPRYTHPANIEIGDLIRAVWKVGDVEHSRTATVHKREYEGADRVLLAADGQEIMRWHPAHTGPRVTLLREAEAVKPLPLFEAVEELQARFS